MFHFYTHLKHQKSRGSLEFFQGYRNGTLARNEFMGGTLPELKIKKPERSC